MQEYHDYLISSGWELIDGDYHKDGAIAYGSGLAHIESLEELKQFEYVTLNAHKFDIEEIL